MGDRQVTCWAASPASPVFHSAPRPETRDPKKLGKSSPKKTPMKPWPNPMVHRQFTTYVWYVILLVMVWVTGWLGDWVTGSCLLLPLEKKRSWIILGVLFLKAKNPEPVFSRKRPQILNTSSERFTETPPRVLWECLSMFFQHWNSEARVKDTWGCSPVASASVTCSQLGLS